MNPVLANDLARCYARDLRHQSDRYRRPAPMTANRRHRQSPLRRQIGFRLMEAGLYLVSGSAD
jgi:hypothetical protein